MNKISKSSFQSQYYKEYCYQCLRHQCFKWYGFVITFQCIVKIKKSYVKIQPTFKLIQSTFKVNIQKFKHRHTHHIDKHGNTALDKHPTLY